MLHNNSSWHLCTILHTRLNDTLDQNTRLFNCTNPKQHFYKHVYTGSVNILTILHIMYAYQALTLTIPCSGTIYYKTKFQHFQGIFWYRFCFQGLSSRGVESELGVPRSWILAHGLSQSPNFLNPGVRVLPKKKTLHMLYLFSQQSYRI